MSCLGRGRERTSALQTSSVRECDSAAAAVAAGERTAGRQSAAGQGWQRLELKDLLEIKFFIIKLILQQSGYSRAPGRDD